MDLIHKFLNVVLPLVALIVILLFMPPFLIYKFFHYLVKAFIPTEKFARNVVLITGTSLGIGENLAYDEYARRGARLTQVARRAERLKAVAAKDVGLGSPDAFVIRADVSEIKDCKRLVEETMNHFGQRHKLLGSVYCTQFAIPHLRKSKGKILDTSSSAAWYCPPRFSVYSASKAALISFFETLNSEYGSDIGITTPGIIESEMTGDQFWSKTGIRGVPVESNLWLRKENCGRCF